MALSGGVGVGWGEGGAGSPVGGPSSESGVMGEAQRPSEGAGEVEPGEWHSLGCMAAISRYQSRQEMFSSRRPSLSDCLHFVNTAEA